MNPADLRAWLELMSAEPNHVGSPHDKANAEFMLAKFREWGWDAHIETFQVLYPTPKSETLEMVDAVCREILGNSKAFGGLQVVLCVLHSDGLCEPLAG